jgi:hypothetical protein
MSESIPYAEEQCDIEGVTQAFTMRRLNGLLKFCDLHGLAEERSAIRRVIDLMFGNDVGTDAGPLCDPAPLHRSRVARPSGDAVV